jgi:murein DD-endopeptidase MepM/ murein hydrolase activator NlpD
MRTDPRCEDLPQHQRDLVLAKKPDVKVVYFFYAHLSEINVAKTDVSDQIFFAKGTILGTTGYTGNAKKMSVISKGAHLHFEVRFINGKAGLGLVHRMDPKPLINNCN